MKYLAAILAVLALFGVWIYTAQAQTTNKDDPPILRLRQRVSDGQNPPGWMTRSVWIDCTTIVCVEPAEGVHAGHTYIRVAGYHWQYVYTIEDPPNYVAAMWALATQRPIMNAP